MTETAGYLGELRRWIRRSVRRVHRRWDYLDAYRRDTDLRVQDDPHAAVGGLWDVIGPLQYDYLIDHGLRPQHRMLDIGCGTLRGGRHFIRYLAPGCYTGLYISAKAIEYGERLVRDEGLAHKRPRLLVSTDHDLEFAQFSGETFDYVLAQSVFTHLSQEHIAQSFERVARIMHPASVFFFTYNQADRIRRKTWKGFLYPFSFFEGLAARHGSRVEAMTDYRHPRGQRMVRMTQRT